MSGQKILGILVCLFALLNYRNAKKTAAVADEQLAIARRNQEIARKAADDAAALAAKLEAVDDAAAPGNSPEAQPVDAQPEWSGVDDALARLGVY